MGSSLAEVVFWGQCFSQGTDIGLPVVSAESGGLAKPHEVQC